MTSAPGLERKLVVTLITVCLFAQAVKRIFWCVCVRTIDWKGHISESMICSHTSDSRAQDLAGLIKGFALLLMTCLDS